MVKKQSNFQLSGGLELWVYNVNIFNEYRFKLRIATTHSKLLAVKYVPDSFGEMLRNQSVQVNTDNSSACRILSVSSGKTYLQNTTIDIFTFYSADYYSREKDTDKTTCILW